MSKKKMMSFDALASKGYHFPGAKGWIEKDDFGNITNMNQIVRDQALITVPNTAVPVELLGYISPTVVQILTAPRNATALGEEVKNGTWTNAYTKWRIHEKVGNTEPYSDKADVGTSNTNDEWQTREQYIFQTIIEWGDLEVDLNAEARVPLIADKQEAAAYIIAVDANRFYLLGVEGRGIYGFFNDPNLPAAITAPNGAAGTPQWSTKTMLEIYNDILLAYQRLVDQTNGVVQGAITQNTPLTLAISPQSEVDLGRATEYGTNVVDLLRKFFSNLEIVTIPELATNAGFQMVLMAKNIPGAGAPTAEFAYGEKLRAGRVVPEVSSFRQKYASSTYGSLLKVPAGVVVMTDI